VYFETQIPLLLFLFDIFGNLTLDCSVEKCAPTRSGPIQRLWQWSTKHYTEN